MEAIATMRIDEQEHLSQRHFQRLAAFIENYSGIKIPPTKITMVEGRLRRRLRATGVSTLKQYCDYLFDRNGLASETVPLIDVMTTNKTEFFREPDHFRFLTEHAVPALMARPGGKSRSVRVWSAACSTGAEPYTIAMVLADLGQHLASGFRFDIMATDISTEVLDTAVAGIYPEAMIQPVPPEFRHRYVWRSKDRSRHLVRMSPEMRAAVRFARINLMEPPYPIDREMDIIFCRNMLIYFDKPTQETVLQRLCEHLRPGGFLFLGHSETIAGYDLPVQPAGPTAFLRL